MRDYFSLTLLGAVVVLLLASPTYCNAEEEGKEEIVVGDPTAKAGMTCTVVTTSYY